MASFALSGCRKAGLVVLQGAGEDGVARGPKDLTLPWTAPRRGGRVGKRVHVCVAEGGGSL